MVTPWQKWFRQNLTHLTTYLRRENKLKEQSIALHSPFFEVPRHKNGFIQQMTNPTFFRSCLQLIYSEPHMHRKTHVTFAYQSHWLRLWSFLPVGMHLCKNPKHLNNWYKYHNFLTVWFSFQLCIQKMQRERQTV